MCKSNATAGVIAVCFALLLGGCTQPKSDRLIYAASLRVKLPDGTNGPTVDFERVAAILRNSGYVILEQSSDELRAERRDISRTTDAFPSHGAVCFVSLSTDRLHIKQTRPFSSLTFRAEIDYLPPRSKHPYAGTDVLCREIEQTLSEILASTHLQR